MCSGMLISKPALRLGSGDASVLLVNLQGDVSRLARSETGHVAVFGAAGRFELGCDERLFPTQKRFMVGGVGDVPFQLLVDEGLYGPHDPTMLVCNVARSRWKGQEPPIWRVDGALSAAHQSEGM